MAKPLAHPALVKRFCLPVSVYLILKQNQEVLLLRRFQTGFSDGLYGVVAGCIDGNESVVDALIREAKEEAGIKIDRKDLSFPTTMHLKGGENHWEAFCFFFVAENWTGEIINNEPHKCDELQFYHLDNLPSNMIPYVKEGMFAAIHQIPFIEHGWEGATFLRQ